MVPKHNASRKHIRMHLSNGLVINLWAKTYNFTFAESGQLLGYEYSGGNKVLHVPCENVTAVEVGVENGLPLEDD